MTLTVQQARQKAESEALKKISGLIESIDKVLSVQIEDRPGVKSFYVSIYQHCALDSPIFRELKRIYSVAGWKVGNPRKMNRDKEDYYRVRFDMGEEK